LKAPYTAITDDEIEALRDAEKDACIAAKIEQNLLSALIHLDLPGFDAAPKILIEARQDSEGFEAFRKTLRSASASSLVSPDTLGIRRISSCSNVTSSGRRWRPC
jgi:hypothetical protein